MSIIFINKHVLNTMEQQKFRFSKNRTLIENSIGSFFVSHGYRIGFLNNNIDISMYDNLKCVEIENCCSSQYICIDETYNKYINLISRIRSKSFGVDKTYHDNLTILLGYPCNFPEKSKNIYRYSLFVKEDNNKYFVQIFSFTSAKKLNISKFKYKFLEGINHYNIIFGTSYKLYYSY